jgi:hypothetical protein
MKIGLVSDTHNCVEPTKRAIKIFIDNNVELIIHAGDLTSPKMLELFEGLKCIFVLGNGDIDYDYLNSESARLGFGQIERCKSFEIEGKKFVVFHGDDIPLFREAVRSGRYNYIIKGHTHFFENYISNKSRIINPGALYGAEEFTIAILDTIYDRVERIAIDAA